VTGHMTSCGYGFPSRFRCGALVLTAATGLLAGCTQFGPAERESLRQASQLYSRDDFPGATARLDRLIADHGQAVEIGEAHYVRGLCRLRAGQERPAMEDLKQAIDRSHRSDLTAYARASLAAIYHRQGYWTQAANLYADALPALPAQPPKDTILFSAGVALQRAGRWRDATMCFSELLRVFRDRPIAAQARQKGQWRHDYFAIQLGAFSEASRAESEVRNWQRRGMDAVQESVPRGGQSLWVVMTGQYPTYAQAVEALKRVRTSVPDAYIIP